MNATEDGLSYVPSDESLAHSNVARFMKKHGISDWRQLVHKANSDITWYWDAVNGREPLVTRPVLKVLFPHAVRLKKNVGA
ncbi:MAG: hypothetical protein ACREBU_24535 [Nitrososphaera sp.]